MAAHQEAHHALIHVYEDGNHVAVLQLSADQPSLPFVIEGAVAAEVVDCVVSGDGGLFQLGLPPHHSDVQVAMGDGGQLNAKVKLTLVGNGFTHKLELFVHCFLGDHVGATTFNFLKFELV